MSMRVVRHQPHRLLQGRHSLCGLVFCEERAPQIIEGVGLVGFQSQHSVELRDGLP